MLNHLERFNRVYDALEELDYPERHFLYDGVGTEQWIDASRTDEGTVRTIGYMARFLDVQGDPHLLSNYIDLTEDGALVPRTKHLKVVTSPDGKSSKTTYPPTKEPQDHNMAIESALVAIEQGIEGLAA